MSVKRWSTLFGAVLVATAAACSSGDDTDAADTTVDSTTQAPPAGAPATPPAPTPGSGAQLPAGVTPEMVAAGEAQWKGGAICVACHGPDAGGTALAPNLRDSQWLNIADGTYEQIVQVINTGVPTPKEHPGMMPAKGGATLTDAQVNELAAYIYSISHGG